MKPGTASGVGMQPVNDRTLRMARSLAARDWERPKAIQRARHMAHDGASSAEIVAALGWDCSKQTAAARFKKYNIKPHNRSDRAHLGEETGLPWSANGVDASLYRPGVKGAAL